MEKLGKRKKPTRNVSVWFPEDIRSTMDVRCMYFAQAFER
jgi:hypothetical protein